MGRTVYGAVPILDSERSGVSCRFTPMFIIIVIISVNAFPIRSIHSYTVSGGKFYNKFFNVPENLPKTRFRLTRAISFFKIVFNYFYVDFRVTAATTKKHD